ncbi:hypothetical protein ANCCAN_24920 [Ancylostoma caninum]|uniref:7TM GPCR serpentine receptor class x (Srx) domain-containing protein n=1 Tax=Ancylostoma caninum TaxID=29170 RepID=A0A368FGL9_ANCCA|nr:hypothetical protein ANCCAN_24920 [Ancylostoma caninum]
MFIVASLSAVIIDLDSPKLIRLENGILQLYFGPITTYDSYQCRITYVFTVVVCSICYLSSYQKARKSEYRNAVGKTVATCLCTIRGFMLKTSEEFFQ